MPIGDIAQACGISHNNLMKVARDLRMAGFIDAVRGRCGGIRLARPAGEITLGELVLHTERNLDLGDSASCASPRVAQTETQVFEAAFASFFATLKGFTLADVAQQARCQKTTLAAQRHGAMSATPLQLGQQSRRLTER
jgi:Rrf2 family nitric oxide-sensitive transcriptional repressor